MSEFLDKSFFQINKWQNLSGFSHGFSTSKKNIDIEKIHSNVCSLVNVDTNTKISDTKLIRLKQVHSNKIINVTNVDIAEDMIKNIVSADGIITNLKGYFPTIQTADCVPVLLVYPKKNISGALHAGWRGTAKGISAKAVEMMKEEYGIKPGDIQVAIGPSIGSCCYCVSLDVASQFPDACVEKREGKIYLDLWKANKLQLLNVGIPDENIYTVGLCTYCNRDIFYSYRFDNNEKGRMLSWIGWY